MKLPHQVFGLFAFNVDVHFVALLLSVVLYFLQSGKESFQAKLDRLNIVLRSYFLAGETLHKGQVKYHLSDSPYVETITRGRTASDGSPLRPAEICWHMVLRRLNGTTDLLVVGPWTSAGVISYTQGAELLWIKFKLGTFLPHLPTRHLLDRETILPAAAGKSFWLKGSAWQFPDYENADTFVDRLVRAGVLACDPVVDAVFSKMYSNVFILNQYPKDGAKFEHKKPSLQLYSLDGSF